MRTPCQYRRLQPRGAIVNPAQSVFALVGVVFLGILAMPSGLPIDDAIASDDPLAAAIEKFDQGDNASAARVFESRLRSVPGT